MEIRETDDGKVIQKNMADDIKMLVSAMIKKDQKAFTRVSFVRGKDWAEGIVPDAVIEKSEGFNEEELMQLTDYLAREKDMILEQAKGVNPIKNLFSL